MADSAGAPNDRPRAHLIRSRRSLILLATVVIVVILGVALVPFFLPELGEEPTPRLLQERGVQWRVTVEEPIPFEDVEPLMKVFVNQVAVLFSILTYGLFYEHIPDDEWLNYSTDAFRDSYASFRPPARGPVVIPIYFLTGYGWSWSKGVTPAWTAYRQPQYVQHLEELLFGFTMFRSEEYNIYPLLTANRIDTLVAMLHEFGHSLGFRDLYPNGDIGGCDDLPIVMAASGNPEGLLAYHDAPPRLEGLIMNRTWATRSGSDSNGSLLITDIEEAYLFNNTLHFVSYSLVTRPGEAWFGNARETIYDLDQIRTGWTREEAAFIGMAGVFPYSCPQEFD